MQPEPESIYTATNTVHSGLAIMNTELELNREWYS